MRSLQEIIRRNNPGMTVTPDLGKPILDTGERTPPHGDPLRQYISNRDTGDENQTHKIDKDKQRAWRHMGLGNEPPCTGCENCVPPFHTTEGGN